MTTRFELVSDSQHQLHVLTSAPSSGRIFTILRDGSIAYSELARIAAALSSGTWPKSGDPAEESAVFARQLLNHAVLAKEAGMGVCWEYRGKVST